MKAIKELFVKRICLLMMYCAKKRKCFCCLWKLSEINIGAAFSLHLLMNEFPIQKRLETTAKSLIVYVFRFLGVVKQNWAIKSHLK